MPLRDVRVIWLQPGVTPSTAVRTGSSPHGSDIRAAIEEVIHRPRPGLEPWLRAGSGNGAEVVNRQGIEILREIYNAGVSSGVLI